MSSVSDAKYKIAFRFIATYTAAHETMKHMT
jgi:hypothetical protein